MIMKKKKIVFIGVGICVLALVIVLSVLLINSSNKQQKSEADKQDTIAVVTISNKLKKTNLKKDNVYATAYKNYKLNDKYEYYSCLIKVDNRSDANIVNVYFDEIKDDNFLIDYDCGMFDPFYIEKKTVGYVTCIISVKKGISKEELAEIPYQLPKKIHLGFTNDSNDVSYTHLMNAEYKVTSDDFSNQKVQIHYTL